MAEYISFQPSDFFSTTLFTGTGSTLAVTGVGFQPDLVWQKNRSITSNHLWTDAVRGTDSQIYCSSNSAEGTLTNVLTSFDSDGFTAGTSSDFNGSTNLIATWNWKAGTASGITGGTITPTSYSINTTSGFGIYEFTGTGSAGTIAHGLGVAPQMVIVKKTNTTGDWYVYHKNMPSGNGYHMTLNTSAIPASGTEWNSTDPTSTVFSLGANSNVNASAATFMAYAFAPIKGYSQFGSYTANGAVDGPFIYTGFRPAFVMLKASVDGTNHWCLFDPKRTPYNPEAPLFADNTDNESTVGTGYPLDIVSNGFKPRSASSQTNSISYGSPYIYAAFAEFPIVSSNDVPGVAR